MPGQASVAIVFVAMRQDQPLLKPAPFPSGTLTPVLTLSGPHLPYHLVTQDL